METDVVASATTDTIMVPFPEQLEIYLLSKQLGVDLALLLPALLYTDRSAVILQQCPCFYIDIISNISDTYNNTQAVTDIHD